MKKCSFYYHQCIQLNKHTKLQEKKLQLLTTPLKIFLTISPIFIRSALLLRCRALWYWEDKGLLEAFWNVRGRDFRSDREQLMNVIQCGTGTAPSASVLTYSMNASLDARSIAADMFALSPTRGQVGLLAVVVALVG